MTTRSERKAAALAEEAEFGDKSLAGQPSIAQLIAALPEGDRAAYREGRRTALAHILALQGLPKMTWREYFERQCNAQEVPSAPSQV